MTEPKYVYVERAPDAMTYQERIARAAEQVGGPGVVMHCDVQHDPGCAHFWFDPCDCVADIIITISKGRFVVGPTGEARE